MKKRFLTAVMFTLVACNSFGNSALDLAKDGGAAKSAAASPAPWMPLVQLAVTVALLYGLIRFVGPKVISKVGGKLNPKNDSLLHIVESATLAQGSLYVVSIYGQQYLVGAANSGINCLANLSDARQAFDSEKVFFETLDEKVEEAPEEWPITNEIASAMAIRLDEISKQKSEPLTHAVIAVTKSEPELELASVSASKANAVHEEVTSRPYWAVKNSMTNPEPSTPAQAPLTPTNLPQAGQRTLQNPFAEAMQREQKSATRSTVLSENSPVDPLSRLDWITGGRSTK